MGRFRRKQHADEAEDLLYEAWVVIANAHAEWDDPERTDPGWAAAARRWRDRWQKHIRLDHRRPEPEERPAPSRDPGATEIYTRDIFGSRRATIPPLAATLAKSPMWSSETTTTWPLKPPKPDATELERDIARAINRNSRENASNTPDFVLAEYLVRCLEAYEAAARGASGGTR